MAKKHEVKETWDLRKQVRVSDQTKQALKVYCAKNNVTEGEVTNKAVQEFLASKGAWTS